MRRVLGMVVLLLAAQGAFGAAGLRVKCNMDGAAVFLDGRAQGSCPAKLTPSAGHHRLVVEKAGSGDTVYRYQTDLNLSDGEIYTVDANLAATVTEDGLYRRGNDDAYLQSYPNGKYVRAIQDKRRQAAEAKRREELAAAEAQRKAEREAAEALRQAKLAQKEAQKKVEGERKTKAAGWKAAFEAQVAASGAVFRDCPDCPEMVVIPPGNFVMGSTDPAAEKDEWPPHVVTLAQPFALGKNDVTVGQYTACVEAGGCRPPIWLEKGNDYNIQTGKDTYYKDKGEAISGKDQPITGVSWDDARAYVNWLAGKTGKPYRLPSEAEWEYAARAGTTTPFYTGECINTGLANYDGNVDYNNCGAKTGIYREKPTKVGSFPPNAFGLHDMSGNVWQWLADCYQDSYSGAPVDGSAWTAAECSDGRVVRGGSWGNEPRNARSANRDRNEPGDRVNSIGFRPARMLP